MFCGDVSSMSSHRPPPGGFTPIDFGLDIPFVEHFFPTYERVTADGVDIGAWITDPCCNAGKMAHGAFLMALGDFATTRATFEQTGKHNRFTVHLNFSMNFYAPAPLGCWLEARARVARRGRSVIYTTCDYFADGEPVGRADAILKSSERRENNPDQ